jgi:hypothetical protein
VQLGAVDAERADGDPHPARPGLGQRQLAKLEVLDGPGAVSTTARMAATFLER